MVGQRLLVKAMCLICMDSENQLVVDHIEVTAEFMAYGFEVADELEAKLVVEMAAVGIVSRYTCYQRVITQVAATVYEEQHQFLGYATVHILAVKVYGGLHSASIGSSLLPWMHVAVSGDTTVGLAYYIGVFRRDVPYAPGHILYAERFLLETDGGVGHIRVVDAAYLRSILGGDIAIEYHMAVLNLCHDVRQAASMPGQGHQH